MKHLKNAIEGRFIVSYPDLSRIICLARMPFFDEILPAVVACVEL